MNYNPAGPWAGPYPVTVVDEDTGTQWEAYGPNQLKKPTVVIAQPEDCCLYVDELNTVMPAEGNPPAFTPPGKSDGDTYQVCHVDGIVTYVCAGGVWVEAYRKKIIENAFIEGRCSEDEQHFELVDCFGNGICVRPKAFTDRSLVGAATADVDENTPLGPLEGFKHVLDFDVGKCPTSVRIDMWHSWAQIKSPTADGGGKVDFRPEYQLNGGPWIELGIGGVDAYYVTDTNNVTTGEPGFDDWRVFDVPAGANQVCMRLNITANTLENIVRLQQQQSAAQVVWWGMTCCPLETAEG